MNTLSYIHKRSRKRRIVKNATGKNIPWYKISSNGKCPDNDNYDSLKNVYWNHFGCNPYEFIGYREIKGKNAEQCAAERMADMKDLLRQGKSIDNNHIYPIKLAYDMGRHCLQHTLYYDSYINKFKNYYNEMTKEFPQTIPIFQSQIGATNYPLETNLKNIKNFINDKIKTAKNKIKNNSRNKTKKNVHVLTLV